MSLGPRRKRGGKRSSVKTLQQLCTSPLLEDSDSDEEELQPLQLSQSSAGSGAKKSLPSSSNSLASSEAADEDDNSKEATSPPSPPSNDDNKEEAVLGRRARETIARNDYMLDFVKKHDLPYQVNVLFWHKSRTKDRKKELWVPCRKAKDYEGAGLKLQRRRDQVLVYYIGLQMKDVAKYKYVSPRQLIPLVDPEEPRTIKAEHMEGFVKSLPLTMKEEALAKPIQKVLERLVLVAGVAECWKRKPNQPEVVHSPTSPDDAILSQETYDTVMEGFKGTSEGDGELDFSSDEGEEETKNPTRAIAASDDWDPNDEDKKQTLKTGCVVSFTEPNKVACKENLLQSTVVRVTPGRQDDFVLHLASSHMLRREDRVKLLKKMHRGKLQDNEHPKMQAIKDYILERTKGDDGEWVGNRKVEQIKALLEKTSDDIANNAETSILSDIVQHPKSRKKRQAFEAEPPTNPGGSDGGGYEGSPKKKQNKQRTIVTQLPKSKATSKPGQYLGDNTDNKPPNAAAAVTPFEIRELWWKLTNRPEIEGMIKAIQSSTGGSSRRKAAHRISVENLECVLQARNHLFYLVQDSKGSQSVDEILSGIVDSYERQHGDCPFSLSNLQDFLSCDKNHLVKIPILDQVGKELRKWLQQQGCSDADNDKSKDESSTEVPQKSAADDKPSKDPKKPPKSTTTKKRRASVLGATNVTASSKRPPKKNRRKTMASMPMQKLAPAPKGNANIKKHRTTKDKAPDWWLQSSTAELESMIEQIKAEAAKESARSSGRRSKRCNPPHMKEYHLQVAINVRRRMEKAISNSSIAESDILWQIQQRQHQDPFQKDQLRRFLSGDKNRLIRPLDLDEIAKDMNSWLATNSSVDEADKDGTEDPNRGDQSEAALPIDIQSRDTQAGEQEQMQESKLNKNDSMKTSDEVHTNLEESKATSVQQIDMVEDSCHPDIAPLGSNEDKAMKQERPSDSAPSTRSSEEETPVLVAVNDDAPGQLSATVSDDVQDQGASVAAAPNTNEEGSAKSLNGGQQEAKATELSDQPEALLGQRPEPKAICDAPKDEIPSPPSVSSASSAEEAVSADKVGSAKKRAATQVPLTVSEAYTATEVIPNASVEESETLPELSNLPSFPIAKQEAETANDSSEGAEAVGLPAEKTDRASDGTPLEMTKRSCPLSAPSDYVKDKANSATSSPAEDSPATKDVAVDHVPPANTPAILRVTREEPAANTGIAPAKDGAVDQVHSADDLGHVTANTDAGDQLSATVPGDSQQVEMPLSQHAIREEPGNLRSLSDSAIEQDAEGTEELCQDASSTGDPPTAKHVSARKSRRQVKHPPSYTELSLNTKLRKGDVCFPKVAKEQDETNSIRSLVSCNEPRPSGYSNEQTTSTAATDTMQGVVFTDGKNRLRFSNAAGKSRRRVNKPKSYAEPRLNSKLRQGDEFFPKAEQTTSRATSDMTTRRSSRSFQRHCGGGTM